MITKFLKKAGVRGHLSKMARISACNVPNFFHYSFSSTTEVIDDQILNAKRIYKKYSAESKKDINLTNDVSLVRSSASKTKSSKLKMDKFTQSLGSMLYSLEIVNNSPNEKHDPQVGSSIFIQTLKGKISACASKVETIGVEHEKFSEDFYSVASSIAKSKP